LESLAVIVATPTDRSNPTQMPKYTCKGNADPTAPVVCTEVVFPTTTIGTAAFSGMTKLMSKDQMPEPTEYKLRCTKKHENWYSTKGDPNEIP